MSILNGFINAIRDNPVKIIVFVTLLYGALGGVLYLPHIHGTFLLDDFTNLESLEQLKAPRNTFSDVLQFLANNQSGQLGRPISLLSFALQAENWPHNPAAFKSINVLIHLLNAILVFIIASFLLKTTALNSQQNTLLSVVIGGLWLALPIHVSTVLYTVQRMTLLMSFFSLIAIAGYLYGRDFCQKSVRTGLLVILLSIIFGTLLAVFSKENGILVFLYIAVIEWTVFAKTPTPKAWKTGRGLLIYGPLCLGGVYFLSHLPHFIEGYASRPFTLSERLLTEARILVDYLTKIVLPRPNSFGLFFDDYIVSTSLFTPISTFFSLFFIAGLLFVAVFSRLKQPLLSFAILWFFAGHTLESTVIPLELYFEHRNYLPALGIVTALCYYSFLWLHRTSSTWVHYCFIALAITYCGGLYFIAFQEASLWNNSALQALTWQEAHPDSKRANALAAQSWLNFNQPIKADLQLQKINRTYPEDNTAYILRLSIDCHFHHLTPKQRTGIFETIASNTPDLATVRSIQKLLELWNTGNCSTLTYQDMLNLLRTLENNATEHLKSHFVTSLSLFYAANSQYDKAIAILDRRIQQKPDEPQLIMLKIRWAIVSQHYDLALSWIRGARKNRKIKFLDRINFENQLAKMENEIHTLNHAQ